MNGKIFPMSEFAVGLNAPPFHPNCENGGIIPCADEDFEEALREAHKEDGVPADTQITLEEFEEKFVNNELTNSRESDIIKGQKLAAQKSFNISDYEIVEDPESVEKFKEFVANNLNITHIQGVDLLKNGNSAIEILESVEALSKEYGVNFSRLSIVDYGETKTIAETFTNELRLNSKFMNSPNALTDILNIWEGDNYIPKSCNDATYVGRHEFYHLITQDLINVPNSKIETLVKRAYKDGYTSVSRNALANCHEEVADLLSAKKLTKAQQKLKAAILKLIK